MTNQVKYIGDISLWKHIYKLIKTIQNINNITCGCETCIGLVFIKSEYNKWWPRQLWNFENMFQNNASIWLDQRTKYLYESYKNEVDPNVAHICGRAYNSKSSHHCISPMTKLKFLYRTELLIVFHHVLVWRFQLYKYQKTLRCIFLVRYILSNLTLPEYV